MGLPLALGCKSLSSRASPPPDPVEEYATDGMVLYPFLNNDQAPMVVTAASPDQSLQAALTITFYDMLRADDGSREFCMAEVCLQIAPLAQAFSSATTSQLYRDSTFRLPLPQTGACRKRDRVTEIQTLSADVVFSQDRRFLTCLIPHPWSADTSVVTFQLRRPRAQPVNRSKSSVANATGHVAPATPPPLPDYLTADDPDALDGGSVSATTAATKASNASLSLSSPNSNGPTSGNSHASASTNGSSGTPTPSAALIGTIPVATKPRMLVKGGVLHDDETRSQQAVTCLCDVASAGNSSSNKSLLLVGCRDGRILAVSYRPFAVAGVVYEPPMALWEGLPEPPLLSSPSNGDVDQTKSSSSSVGPIVSMDHVLEWQDEAGVVAGKLVVLTASGSATLFCTHQRMPRPPQQQSSSSNGHAKHAFHAQKSHSFHHSTSMEDSDRWGGDMNESSSSLAFLNESSTSMMSGLSPGALDDPFLTEHGNNNNNADSVLIGLSKIRTLPGPFSAARWICGSYLALLERPTRTCVVHVYGLASESTTGPVTAVSTLRMTLDQLEDEAHTKYAVRPAAAVGSSNGFVSSPRSHLVYDAYTDCLAVSSFVQDGGGGGSGAHNVSHFCCLWNWRTNTLGLTIKPSRKAWPGAKTTNTSSSSSSSMQSKLHSCLYFAKNKSGQRKLVHITTASGVNPLRVCKDIYEVAVLSPPQDASRRRARIRHTNASLLLTSQSVSYPSLKVDSCLGNYELEWKESCIPSTYLASCGSPIMAALGPNHGRSIAVASSRGLCLLDCSDRTARAAIDQEHAGTVASLTESLKQTYTRERWHLFGNNQSQERRFRVLALTWWEGLMLAKGASNMTERFTRDVVVALVQVDDGDDRGRYLSCWTHRYLDAGHQLIRSQRNGHGGRSSWGCRLPDDFQSEYLDLLVEPDIANACPTEPSTRKACVLLADSSFTTAYHVYQLEVLDSSMDEELPFEILAHCAAKSSVGSPAEVFLASARFSFDLLDGAATQKDDYVATLGIVRTNGGGLSAVAVGTTDVIAFGQVISRTATTIYNNINKPASPSVTDSVTGELACVSLTDVVRNRRFTQDGGELDFFVWTLQTASGSLLTWFVPILQDDDGLFDLVGRERFQGSKKAGGPRAIHRTGLALGYVCKAGSASTWMQQSSQGTKKDYLIGCAPQSSHGCVLGISQSVRKLHRNLGEDFEHELFRPDFLDHELLCPSDFVLYPPAWLPSMYALLIDAGTGRTVHNEETDHVDQHLVQKLNTSALRDTAMMALHLLVLRSAEKVAATSKDNDGDGSEKSRIAKCVFERIVTASRRITTPLQFATLFLEVGRQVEPSVFQHMFPLPRPVDGADDDDKEPESMENLFTMALSLGSVTMAVAALPMFTERKKTISVCAGIFRSCLKAVNRSLENETPLTFDLSRESKEAMGDIFRYARKIEDPCWDDEFEDDDDPANEFSTHSAGESEDEGRAKGGGGTYSILCGFDRLFTRRRESRRKDDAIALVASSFVDHGFDDASTDLGRHSFRRNSTGGAQRRRRRSYASALLKDKIESVTAMTARFIVGSIFEPGTSMAQTRWKKLAVLADLLVGENTTGFQFCSSSAFEGMLRVSTSKSFEVLMPWKTDMVRFFTRNLRESESQIDERASSRVLDLMLILLDTDSSVGDLSKELPGLLLIAMVAAHTADRITDIINYDPRDLPLWNSYLDARYELSSFDDEDSDEDEDEAE